MRKLMIVATMAFGLSACKPPEPSYTHKDPVTGAETKVSASKDGDSAKVTVNGVDGKGTISVSANGEAPKDLPAYIPLYPSAKYEGSFASDMAASPGKEAVRGGMVSFKTSDSADKVLAFYKDAFARGGLKESATGDMGGMKMISFTKGESDAEGAQVMASAAPTGETQVQVMYSLGQ